jgi:hypothetical protein
MSPPWLLLVTPPPAGGPTYTSLAVCLLGVSSFASRKAPRPPATHGDELPSVEIREKVRVETAYVHVKPTDPERPQVLPRGPCVRPDR